MSTTTVADGEYIQAIENVQRLAIHQTVCDELLQIILRNREKRESDTEWLRTIAEYFESLKLWANFDQVELLMQCEAIPDTLALLQQRMSEFDVAIPEDYHKRARQSCKSSTPFAVLAVLRCPDGLERLECLPSTSLHKAMALLQNALDCLSPASDEYGEIRTALMHLQVVDSQATLEAPDLTAQISDISEEPFAKGGFSDVYTGEWLRQEKVALKILRILGGSGATKRHKLFRREVKLWHGLRHPHLLQFWGLCNTSQGLAMVSPFMPNGNASAFLAANPDAGALELLVGAAYGLEYLHTRQPPITHGDLRGANILVSRTGQAQLSDFGLSKIMEAASTDTSVGMTTANAGATRWMAPELFHSEPVEYPPSCASPHPSTVSLTGEDAGDRPGTTEKPRASEDKERWEGVTPRSDVWAYGMTVYELMTGKVPYWRVKTSPTVMLAIVRGELPSKPRASDVRHDWQPQLLELMHECWTQRPNLRPTMTAISETMRSIRDASQARSPVPQSLLLAFDTPLLPLTPTTWPNDADKASSEPLLIDSPITETSHDINYVVAEKEVHPAIELSLPLSRGKSNKRKSTTDSTLAKAEIHDSVPELPASRPNVPLTRADLTRPRSSSAPVAVPTELYLKDQPSPPKTGSMTMFNSENSSMVSLDSMLNQNRRSRPITPATPVPPDPDPPSTPSSPVTRRRQRLSSLSFWKRNSTDKTSTESTSGTEGSFDPKAAISILQSLIQGEESMLRDTYDAVLSSRIRMAHPSVIPVERVDHFLTRVLGSYIKLRGQRGHFLRELKSAEQEIASDLVPTVISLLTRTIDCFCMIYPDYAKGIYNVEDILTEEMENNFPFRAWMQRSEDDMRLKRFLRSPLASIETVFVRLSQLIAFAKPKASGAALLDLKLREDELVGVLMKTRLSKWQGAMGRDEVVYNWRQLVLRTNSRAFMEESRQSVIFKFIEAQMTCLRIVKDFHSGVLRRIVQSPALVLPDLEKVYDSMAIIIEHQQQLMQHLHAHQLESHPLLTDVPQVVFQTITSWGHAYTTYSSQLCDALRELETHSADIFPLVHAISSPTIMDHDIASLLWAPITHLRRLSKALHLLLNVTPDDHVELKPIVESISTITKLVEVCDNLSSASGSSPEIRQLATQLQWQGVEDLVVRLDDPHRQLIHEGKVLIPSQEEKGSGFTELFAIVLDNFFILTTPQMRWGLSFLQVEEVVALENLSILDLDESSSYHDLYLLDTPQGEVIAAPLTLQFEETSSAKTLTLLCHTTLEVLEWRRHLTAAKLTRESSVDGFPKTAFVQHALVASVSFSPSCSAEFSLNGVIYTVVGGSRVNGLWIRAGHESSLRQLLQGVSIRYCTVVHSLQLLLVLVGKALVSYRLEDIAAFKVSSRQVDTKGSVIFFRCRLHKGRPLLVVAVGHNHNTSSIVRIFDSGVVGLDSTSRRSSFFGGKQTWSNMFKQVAEVPVAQILHDCAIFDDCIVLMGSDGFVQVNLERPDEHRQLASGWSMSDPTVLPVFKGLASSQTYHRCQTSKPINIIRHNNITLLCYSDFGVFLKDGGTVQGACIDWTSNKVTQAFYLAPYVLLVSKTTLETRLVHNGKLVDRFDAEELYITHEPEISTGSESRYFHLAARGEAGSRQFDVDELDTFSVHQWSLQRI